MAGLPPDPFGAPPPPQQGRGLKDPHFARLAALIPIALAKGGREGVAGLLSGYQQAMLRKQQMAQQQGQIDFSQQQQLAASRRADADDTRANEQLNLQKQRFDAEENERKRRQFLEQAQALGAIDQSPEAAMTALSQLTPQASALGVPQALVESQFAVTPTGAEKRKLERIVAGVDKTYKDVDPAERDKLKPVDAGGRTVGEIRAALSGVQSGPAASRGDLSKSGLDVQLLDAKRRAAKGEPGAADEVKLIEDTILKGDTLRRDPPRINVSLGGHNPAQVAMFNRIAGEFERSPLTRAADRTVVLKDAIAAVRQDPNNATNQLNLAYGYIQALDTYQSAVREGELANLGRLGSVFQNIAASAQRIVSGNVVPPDVARQIADNASRMVGAIEQGRDQKRREFASRARVSGVGDLWDQFTAGSAQPAPAQPAATAPTTSPPAPAGWKYVPKPGGGWTAVKDVR